MWRFWAQLLTIRQIAGHRGLWRTVAHVTGKASDCDDQPPSSAAIRTLLAGDEPIGNLNNQPDLNSAANSDGRVRTYCGTHPQSPGGQAREVIFRGVRGPSHPGDRRSIR